MSVTVDDRPLPVEQLGLQTVGQVLAHLKKDNRLVVHVLIDGQEPDLKRLAALKRALLRNHTVYIETADPAKMALDVLAQVREHLAEADRLKDDAADLLRKNQQVKAMEKLSGCLTTWQHAHEAVIKTAELLRLDLKTVMVENQPLQQILTGFADQLRQIKSALENRDFVSLCDLLAYETTETSRQWQSAIDAVRQSVEKR